MSSTDHGREREGEGAPELSRQHGSADVAPELFVVETDEAADAS